VKLHKRKTPTGIKIISIIFYSIAIWLVITAFSSLSLLIFKIILIRINPAVNYTTTDSLILTLFLSILATILFFIANGLWKGYRWTLYTTLIILGMIFLLSFISLFKYKNFINLGLIVSASTIGYLLLSKKVKSFFSISKHIKTDKNL